MKGKLYGIGVGPGDSELLTIKAIKIIEKCDIIATPGGSDSELAYNIVKNYLKDKEVITCEFSMSKDLSTRVTYRKRACEQICDILDTGKTVGFLTIGDPTVYSTYMYVHNMVKNIGYETEIISGIPSFVAAAGRLNTSLCEGEQMLHIIPTSKITKEEIRKVLNYQGNKVFMKSARNIKNLLEVLDEEKLENVSIVERCFLEGEKMFYNIKDVTEKDLGYFTVVIVKNNIK
ncbi:MAG: precorrin-2 C(20)-methyltransferase [Bacilli bacterium]